MAKVLKTAAMVVGAAALIATGAGVAIGSAAAVTSALGGISATALSVAAAGLSFASQLLTKPPSVASAGSQTEWTSDLNAPSPIVFGRTMVGGMIIHRKTSGAKNKDQFITSILSGCGPIDGFEATYVDKEVTTFTGGNAVGALHNRVHQFQQLGQCPEPGALLGLGSAPGMTPEHKLSGYAAVQNIFTFDGESEQRPFTQVPLVQHLIRGVGCYDPRQDSTYPGGSGPQRWNDQTTWAVNYNGWVQAITFAIGWRQGPNNIRVGGVGMPVTSIDLPSFVEAANIADANGWKSGGRVVSTDNKWEVLKALCQAGGGEPVKLGATLSCVVNTPRVSIGTITRDDVIGTVSITTTQTRRDRVNGIIPVYRSEDHFFEQVPAGVVRNAAYLAADGQERTKEVTYPMVQCEAGETPDQAAQIAGYDIANAREAGPAVFPLKLRWLGNRAGDCLTIENTPEFGHLASKNVIVLRRQLDPETGGVTLTLREETPGKHTWALGLIGIAAPTTELNVAPDRDAPDEGDWTATPHVVSISGTETGSIEIVGAVDDATATKVLFEYRVAGTTDWFPAASMPISTTRYEIINLDPSVNYDVAVSYHTGQRLIFEDISFAPPTIDWEPDITGNVTEGPDFTFTRTVADGWGNGVRSVDSYDGEQGVRTEFLTGSDICFGLDTTARTSAYYDIGHAWYGNAGGNVRPRIAGTAVGSPLATTAGDVLEVRRTGSSGAYTYEWIVYPAGDLESPTVHHTDASSQTVPVYLVAGAYPNAASWGDMTRTEP